MHLLLRARVPSLALLTLAGCHKAGPLPSSLPVGAGSPSARASAAESPREPGAFVLLGWERTLVVPLDPEREVIELPGYWVGAHPYPQARAWGHLDAMVTAMADPSTATVPVCPSGDFGDACELPVDLDEVDRWEALLSASTMLSLQIELRPDEDPRWDLLDRWGGSYCPCVVVHGLSTDGDPVSELDLSDPEVLEEISLSPYEPEEYLEHCGTEALRPELEPTAYLGGVLYENGMSHNGLCSGLNLYDGASEQLGLRPEHRAPSETFPEPVCTEQPIGIFGPDFEPPDGAEGVECDEAEELLSYAIDRGRLVEATGGVGVVGEGCGCTSSLPLTEAACPSEFDPCGTGEGFEGLDEADHWWVSSDERWALVMSDSQVLVLERGASEPRRVETGIEGVKILGVELHPRSALLEAPDVPEVLRPDLPPRHPDDEDLRAGATKWGNRCFVHLKASRLDAAEAACFAALMAGGDDRARGAITYNLGRVAEARGQEDRALAYYRRSDRLRPGNGTVAARIRALGGR